MKKAVGLQAEEIVDAIVRDMTDRGGFQNEWEATDEETKAEIRTAWMLIARRVIEASH